jgi:hypothetical protein
VPVRKIPKSYQNATGLIATDKSDDQTAYESRLERYTQKLVGFNLNVSKYEEQPITIHFTDRDGRPHTYTPDLLISYREDLAPKELWKPLLVEVKYRKILFEKWGELKPKFRAARSYVKDRGFDFGVITDREVLAPYLRNATFLIDYRWLPVNEIHTNLLLDALRRLRRTTPEALLTYITKERSRVAELIPTLWQLVASYAIAADLEQPLTMYSPIWSLDSRERIASHEIVRPLRRGRARQKRWQALRYYQHLES